MAEQTTDTSSLEAAAARFEGLLSPKSEEGPSEKTQPEQAKATAPEPTQASAEPTEQSEKIEQTESEGDGEETEQDASQPRTFKVKVNGQEIEVTEDEVLKGYSRTEDYTRKTQQLAEQRKTFEEQEVAAVRTERNQYGQYLEQLKTALTALSPVEPDWQALRSQVSPEEFAAELLNWQQNQKRIEHVTAEQAKVKAAQEADAQQGFAKYVQEQAAKLADAIPEFKDPEKSKALKTQLKEFGMSEYGFSEQEFSQVTDSRLVRLLHDARQAKLAKANAPKIENKIKEAMATSEPGSRTSAPPKNELTAAKARLRSTGSVDDAAAAMNALDKRQRK